MWCGDFRSAGDDRAIEQLLKAKANPLLEEQGQEAPLSLAVRTGSLDYVRLLLHYCREQYLRCQMG